MKGESCCFQLRESPFRSRLGHHLAGIMKWDPILEGFPFNSVCFNHLGFFFVAFRDRPCSKVVSTHRTGTHPKLALATVPTGYKPGFLSYRWLRGLPGVCEIGVCCNFLGLALLPLPVVVVESSKRYPLRKSSD